MKRPWIEHAPREIVLECLYNHCGMRLVLEVDEDDNIVGRCISCGYREMLLPAKWRVGL